MDDNFESFDCLVWHSSVTSLTMPRTGLRSSLSEDQLEDPSGCDLAETPEVREATPDWQSPVWPAQFADKQPISIDCAMFFVGGALHTAPVSTRAFRTQRGTIR